jgi:glycerophosphoryl diester phosphodiesterase
MAPAAIRAEHRHMPVNTARVTEEPTPTGGTSPVTGFAYLDAVLDRPGSVIAMAHRGGALHPEIPGVENTLHAFEHAVALGYHYLETDVHATSDGVLLAFHDNSLDRVTDTRGILSRLTVDEVKMARIRGEHPVPTMAELLEAFPDCRFNIDIKAPAAVLPLADLLDRTRSHDRVCVGSFSQRRLDAFRQATGGRVATSATPSEVALFLGLPSGRAARLVTRRRVSALQVPHRRGPLPVVTRSLVRRAHAAGAHVHVWTVDEPAEMDELLDLGVDGLITDRTDVLKQVLLSRDRWMGARP